MVLSHEQEKDFAAPRCDEHAADVVTIVRRFSVRRLERPVVRSQVVRIEVVSYRVSGLRLARI